MKIPIQRRSICLYTTLILFCFATPATTTFSHDIWPEHRGPEGNYHLSTNSEYPTQWSVTTGENIRWRAPLPETGHSGIAIAGNRIFLTCFRNLRPEDIGPKGTWVSECVGYCLSADTGEVLWSCELPGKRPNQVNGTFTDSTTPTPVTDGTHVWFVNAGGFMACHALDGTRIWEKEFEVRKKHSAKQFQPFLHKGNLYYAMMRDASDPSRRPQTAADYDKNSKAGWPWMYVRCFNALTGQPTGIMPEGISVHSKGAVGSLDSLPVLLYAKGGSHSPPEKPYGVGLSRLNSTHDRIWERADLPVEGTHFIDQENAYCFDKNDLLVLDLKTGNTFKRIRIRHEGQLTAFDEDQQTHKQRPTSELKSPHLLTHYTSIGVGNSLFFMAGQPGILGRVNIETEEVAYLQVPIQIKHVGESKQLSWKDFLSGDSTGSGLLVSGDERRLSHGFGHISAATPIVVNRYVYFTTVLGTVYVIDASAERFDQNALVAVNDLGIPGQTWTLSPFSAANGRLYQRTSRELICIGLKN